MVQAGQATSGVPKPIWSKILSVFKEHRAPTSYRTDLLTMPRIIITTLATPFASFYHSELKRGNFHMSCPCSVREQ